MAIYYVNIDVQFKTGLDLTGADGTVAKGYIQGYVCEIGATFDNIDELKQAIEQDVAVQYGSNGIVIYDYIGIIDEADIQKEIYKDKDICDSLEGDPRERGVWYQTGRGFYAGENNMGIFPDLIIEPGSPDD